MEGKLEKSGKSKVSGSTPVATEPDDEVMTKWTQVTVPTLARLLATINRVCTPLQAQWSPHCVYPNTIHSALNTLSFLSHIMTTAPTLPPSTPLSFIEKSNNLETCTPLQSVLFFHESDLSSFTNLPPD